MHDERFFVHCAASPAADEQFSAARQIQAHLIREATELRIELIEDDGSS